MLEACSSNDIHEISINYFENDDTNLVQNQIDHDQRRENYNVNIEIEAIAGACNTIDEVNNTDVPLLYHGPCISNNFIWGEVNGESWIQAIKDAYEEAVSWKRNMFLLPSGKAGKAFVQE